MVSNRGFIYKYNIDTGSQTAPISGGVIMGTDFDWKTNKVYFADTRYGQLVKSNPDGSNREIVSLFSRSFGRMYCVFFQQSISSARCQIKFQLDVFLVSYQKIH